LEEEEDNKKKVSRLILASSSPRRKRILKQLKIDFEVFHPEEVTEEVFRDPRRTVVYNSSRKAQFVYNHVIINNLNCADSAVAGFDTVVYFKGRNVAKPADVLQAECSLMQLSGRSHLVLTGIALIDINTGRMVTGIEATRVKFRKLAITEIRDYLENEDILDKAGAYDISGYGCILVEKIKGCFYNVAGLPVNKLIELAGKLNYRIL